MTRRGLVPLSANRVEIETDIAVIGGGLGGVAAALAATAHGRRVVVTEETSWIGGQLTSQAVPPDEHAWIESFGATASYRAMRDAIRSFYREHLPLTARARTTRFLNPGNGWVSRLCHDPRVAVAVLADMTAEAELAGRLVVLRGHRPVAATTAGDRIRDVVVVESATGVERRIEAAFFVDATPFGDLLELASVEHVASPERRADTGEPHAEEDPHPQGEQAVTVVFAVEDRGDEDHTIERPAQYARFRDMHPPGWPGPLFSFTAVRPETGEPMTRPLFASGDEKSWWAFRRILDKTNFDEGFAPGDVTLVNWPQNDFWFGPMLGASPAERERSLSDARQLGLSFLYWLQTEAPRPDGGAGYRGLRLRPDVVGNTADGLAQAPYVRSSRRLRAETTVVEQDIAHPLRPRGPELFPDTVGIGGYRIDLHPQVGGRGYLDIGAWPFQIPLGAMVPVRVENLLPGGKNLGVTHVTNGAFRVHPVEWNVGEVAGALAAFCLDRNASPRGVRASPRLLGDFQALLVERGVELAWPVIHPI